MQCYNVHNIIIKIDAKYSIRVKGPHNVGDFSGDFSGRSGRSPGSLLTYLGLYTCSNAPKEGFPGIRQVFFISKCTFSELKITPFRNRAPIT